GKGGNDRRVVWRARAVADRSLASLPSGGNGRQRLAHGPRGFRKRNLRALEFCRVAEYYLPAEARGRIAARCNEALPIGLLDSTGGRPGLEGFWPNRRGLAKMVFGAIRCRLLAADAGPQQDGSYNSTGSSPVRLVRWRQPGNQAQLPCPCQSRREEPEIDHRAMGTPGLR